jgi:alpha 1,4-glycosyltransferase
MQLFRDRKQILPPETFCPVDWWRWKIVINGDPVSRFRITLATRKSYAVHLWNEMWRRADVDKQSSFPP